MSQLLDTQPKYARIADLYRRQIEAGELRPGDKLPSFTEVRTQLGIGQSTLERAHELLEKEALIIREPGKGIFVASRQQKPRSGIVGLSGIHVAKGHHPYFARLLEGVHQTAHQAGVEILLLHEDVPVVPDKVDGVLLYHSVPDTVLRRLPPSLPVVSLLTAARGVASVTVDDSQGIAQAVEHLVDQGHRRIAYLSTWHTNPVSQRRVQVYRQALERAGIEANPLWVRHLPDPEAMSEMPEVYRAFVDWGREVMTAWLADDWRQLGCTALLAHNDDTAIGAIRAMTSQGISVPGDVSVIGFDDTLSAEMFEPPLSTVHVPLREIGAKALEILLAEIQTEGSSEIGNRLFTPSLVVRGSSAPFSAR